MSVDVELQAQNAQLDRSARGTDGLVGFRPICIGALLVLFLPRGNLSERVSENKRHRRTRQTGKKMPNETLERSEDPTAERLLQGREDRRMGF